MKDKQEAFGRKVRAIKARNADADPTALQAEIDDTVRNVRKKRQVKALKNKKRSSKTDDFSDFLIDREDEPHQERDSMRWMMEDPGLATSNKGEGAPTGGNSITIDENKIDKTILALLYMTLHEKCRAWKTFDWNSMNRLHEKGFIADPANKAKSVILTEKGRDEAERLFKELFIKK